jgi:hypothetical protein
MPGIYIAAILTTILSAAIIGGSIAWKSRRSDWWWLSLVFLIAIPAFFAAFYGLRMPLDVFLKDLLSRSDELYQFLKNFYAPLTEESAKLAIALIPFAVHKLRKENLHFVAFSIGLGFGVGEIWFLAYAVAQSSEFSVLPWYLFSGFLFERFQVCFLHGAFVLVALHYLNQQRFRGIAYAMGLHFLLNFPIYVRALNPGDLSQTLWQSILTSWVLGFSLFMLAVTAKVLYGKMRVGYLLLGQATCPECGETYDRPLFGLNMVNRRYERCPYCKHFHWIR